MEKKGGKWEKGTGTARCFCSSMASGPCEAAISAGFSAAKWPPARPRQQAQTARQMNRQNPTQLKTSVSPFESGRLRLGSVLTRKSFWAQPGFRSGACHSLPACWLNGSWLCGWWWHDPGNWILIQGATLLSAVSCLAPRRCHGKWHWSL